MLHTPPCHWRSLGSEVSDLAHSHSVHYHVPPAVGLDHHKTSGNVWYYIPRYDSLINILFSTMSFFSYQCNAMSLLELQKRQVSAQFSADLELSTQMVPRPQTLRWLAEKNSRLLQMLPKDERRTRRMPRDERRTRRRFLDTCLGFIFNYSLFPALTIRFSSIRSVWDSQKMQIVFSWQ